tara:strand:+ start:1954 stop:2163 length:210 start_codon:yes stop_codon:yes gene_type:complete
MPKKKKIIFVKAKINKDDMQINVFEDLSNDKNIKIEDIFEGYTKSKPVNKVKTEGKTEGKTESKKTKKK